MKHSMFLAVLPLLAMVMACNSDDYEGKGEPVPTVTTFSGVVLYETNMEPVTNGELFINGTDTEPLRSPQTRAQAILKIEDGTFEVSFETIEEVDRFGMFVNILQGTSIINTFVAGSDPPLKCQPGNCDNFPPGQDYELIILVPCAPDDCILFPPE
ncbi:hypothetical protein CSC80_10755 [Maribacter sp. 6B07]|uniref:hypothetical protein n=1 Tax=Maribacter sp. 6B07 TaxID=2045442 RepID=UPI000C080F19|nr:hypothetical protein [Maribacter sp. 6B07]PHN93399.1 hypothetical protein CSC80_10755 [Maribacter sp. 6B07]